MAGCGPLPGDAGAQSVNAAANRAGIGRRRASRGSVMGSRGAVKDAGTARRGTREARAAAGRSERQGARGSGPRGGLPGFGRMTEGIKLAEGQGFEPWSPGLPVKRFSRPPHSTALPPLRLGCDGPVSGLSSAPTRALRKGASQPIRAAKLPFIARASRARE